MSLDKAMEHGKEYREEYHGSKAFDRTCRNHGGCEWCAENRRIQYIRMEEKVKQQFREYEDEYDLDFNQVSPF